MMLYFFFFALTLLLGFSSSLPVAGEEEIHHDLQFEYHEIVPHIRSEDGEHALRRAVMRRMDKHFSTEESIKNLHARGLHGKMLNTRATIFYRPDLDRVCRENNLLKAHATSTSNQCVSARSFSVGCDREEPPDIVYTVHGDCNPDYFCVTVLKGTMNIIDPDNRQIGQALEPICTKQFSFKTTRIVEKAIEFLSELFHSPANAKVFFGRMAVLGNTAGVEYRLRWEYTNYGSTLFSTAGIKLIEPENHGDLHEYELSYNYNNPGGLYWRAGVKDLGSWPKTHDLHLNVWFGAV